MLKIKRVDKISNDVLYKRVKQEPLCNQIQKRQLRFVGHSLRKPTTELINQYVLYEPPERYGKRKPGRPKLSYIKYISRLVNNDVPPTVNEIRDAAANRENWKKIVNACKPVIAAD